MPLMCYPALRPNSASAAPVERRDANGSMLFDIGMPGIWIAVSEAGSWSRSSLNSEWGSSCVPGQSMFGRISKSGWQLWQGTSKNNQMSQQMLLPLIN
mmetsp:Transcript_22574/g.35313  ORF Transcript_22574/g.35313 Transcript_22574/m.35313 type:complete len:98 (-) Transcript_22574:54-347(-)